MKFPADKSMRSVRVASLKRRMLYLDKAEIGWLVEKVADDLSVNGIQHIIDGDRDEGVAAVADMGLDPTGNPLEASALEAQRSDAGFTVRNDFNGKSVATITREGPLKGNTIEMDVKQFTKKKWEDIARVKGYAYLWANVTSEQKKRAALEYLELQVPNFIE